MAINTENRRRSVSGYTSLPMLPVANAVIDAFDREMVAWLYAGIAATVLVQPVLVNIASTVAAYMPAGEAAEMSAITGTTASASPIGTVQAVTSPGGS